MERAILTLAVKGVWGAAIPIAESNWKMVRKTLWRSHTSSLADMESIRARNKTIEIWRRKI